MIFRATFAIVRRELAFGGALHAAAYFTLCAFIGFWSAHAGTPVPDSIAPGVALALGRRVHAQRAAHELPRLCRRAVLRPATPRARSRSHPAW